MDTLKDVLLMFTVVVLVYVLYQRLLQVLGKKERSRKYASVSETMEWQGRMLTMRLEAEQRMTLRVSVKKATGEEVILHDEQQVEIGSHQVQVDCDMLAPGRYYVSMHTPAQEYSRYFEIE